MIQGGKRRAVCHGDCHCGRDGLFQQRASPAGKPSEERRTSTPAVGHSGRARRCLAGSGSKDWRHGSSDAAGLGDPVQRTGPDGLINKSAPGAPGKLTKKHKAFLVGLVEEGPIPAIHGVVRWRACDLIMCLHEEFGLSVSDDTVYRALKELGFSHVSARPKAYKQDADAVETFKKTFPAVWRRSARSLRLAHR